MIFLILSVSTIVANPFISTDEETQVIQPVRSGSVGPTKGLIDIQFGFREHMAEYLQRIKEEPGLKLFLSLGLAAFVYGLLHGAGPGHRKTIIFSLFIGRDAKAWEPLAAGFLAAGVHAGVSLILILVFDLIIKGAVVLTSTNQASIYLEGVTYMLLALFTLVLLIRRFSLGHAHNERTSSKGMYSMIIVSSLIPCPGATMLLLFSISLDILIPGIFGLICMSLGMGVVISLAGYLAYAGREGIFYRLKQDERTIARISVILEALTYLFIIIFSLYMAWPFIRSLVEKLLLT